MIYQRLPGIQWRHERPNRLLVYLPDSVLKIEGTELSCAVDAVLSRASGGASRQELRDAACCQTGVKAGVYEYAFDLLIESRVLFGSETPNALTALQAYYYLKEGNAYLAERLMNSRIVCYCFVDDRPFLSRAFRIAGLRADIRALQPGGAVSYGDLTAHDAVACVGIPFHHPFARSLNSWAIGAATLVLFSEYGGGTGRVGPTVIGRDLACLDCVSARHAANGGGGPLEATEDGIPQLTEACLTPPVSHPILRELLLQHSVLEMSRILLRNAPASFGGYLELNATGATKRREVLKVPRCISCALHAPERYPFDAVAVS